MDNDLTKYLGDDYLSPGSIGGKIKRYREAKGLTQKQLGKRCGYKESTADVRIAQYEKNKKTPKGEALSDIAGALEVDEEVFYDGDLLSYNKMYHVLFDLEDFHALAPVQINGEYFLFFGGYDMFGRLTDGRDMQEFLRKWYEMHEKCKFKPTDNEHERKTKQNEYLLWKGSYIKHREEETNVNLEALREMDRLQAKMDKLYAETQADTIMTSINIAVGEVMPLAQRNYYLPRKKESDFILLVMDLIRRGLKVEMIAPDATYRADQSYTHLLSIQVDSFLNDENKLHHFAAFTLVIQDLVKAGINIVSSITSKNKELYITYRYAAKDYRYFALLQESWDEIREFSKPLDDFIANPARDKREVAFIEKIQGDSDVEFPSGTK